MVRKWSAAETGILLAAALALAAVVTLAVLQYNWLGRLSAAEQERLQAHVAAAAEGFAREFDGEIARVYSELLAGPRFNRGLQINDVSARYREWKETAVRPRLVRSLQLTTDDAVLRAGDPFQLVSPLLPPGPVPPPGKPPEGWLVAQLDADYIAREWLPELAQKYFAHSAELSFAVRVVSRVDPDRVIFTTDNRLPAAFFMPPDAAADLFVPRMGPPRLGFDRPDRPDRPGRPDRLDRPARVGRGGRWLVLVKERSGSLAGAVAHARRRNLGISFAVLLALAAAAVALLVSARRQHRLAQAQMEFVAGVSHELRSPLSVICAAGDNLAEGLVTQPQQVRRYGETVRAEGRRLTHMVNQVLSFAGLQSGRVRYDIEPVPAENLADRALDLCDFDESRIEVRIAPGTPPLRGDAAALAQALRNLLENAVRHGGESGRVTLEMRGAGGFVEVVVSDEGPGIESADLRHVFDAFYRGRRAVSGQVPGSGIGLALVRRIAEAHGGSVAAASNPGCGARFTMRIPAAVEEGTVG